MKRPKFFEDLDRSLSGESEPVETPAQYLSLPALLQAQATAQCDSIILAQLQQQAQRPDPYSSSIGAALGGILSGVFGRR